MPTIFKRIKRPDAVDPGTTLDTELEKAVDGAGLTLYFINLVVIRASNLINTDLGFNNFSDPYCVVTVGEISDRTETIKDNLDPVWNDKMSFFVPKKPEFLTFGVFDNDANKAFANKDDPLGDVNLKIGHLFAEGGSFEGKLKLKNVKKGSIFIKLKCRVMKPIETEVKLGFAKIQLEGKKKEQEATVLALDESEQLREDAINELGAKEQEVIRKAEELEERQRLHQTELTTKEKNILDQAQIIEEKIQKYEEAQVALMETEIQKKEAETKLTAAEEVIVEKARELERKERENAEALTHKEKAILAAAERLAHKERAYEEAQRRMAQIEGLKAEVENELTSKEHIILRQADELRKKDQEGTAALTRAEADLLRTSRELEARDATAKIAQRAQDENEDRLARLMREHGQQRREIEALKGRQEKPEEGDTRVRELEEELRGVKKELKELHERAAPPTAGFCSSFSNCFRKPTIDVTQNNDDETHQSQSRPLIS
eukprot:CAMPEP_0194287018 /NCGR_PEP_ID=MMETSP0169-20130528/33827_1 /TAXON_ID=218684 /ORGANISM="Corethron pennatum, Strain L29A3" /LENGTH=490 /DNA_ID=CAMNT_0039033593 /DNA_START=127 /DNA_END=1595 /DNA_ORIENTATION=+